MRTQKVELVVLDVLMPVIDGLSLCREIRKDSDVAIMVLAALGQPEEVIAGLEHRADDYVTKPFHQREVALRAQALVRRSHGASIEPVLQVGQLRIDPTQHVATLGGRQLDLPSPSSSCWPISLRTAARHSRGAPCYRWCGVRRTSQAVGTW